MLTVLALSLAAPADTPADDAVADDSSTRLLEVDLGKSVLLTLPRPPRSVAITDPQVAGITSLGDSEVWMVQGRALGTTDLVINLGGDDPIVIYDIVVTRDLGDLRRTIDHVVGPEGSRVKLTPVATAPAE